MTCPRDKHISGCLKILLKLNENWQITFFAKIKLYPLTKKEGSYRVQDFTISQSWNIRKILDKRFWVSHNEVLFDRCKNDKWIISFFLLLYNRRRVGLTVFFLGAILYALFLGIFSHYLYCGHYFMPNNSTIVNETTRNYEVFEVSETNNTCIIKLVPSPRTFSEV